MTIKINVPDFEKITKTVIDGVLAPSRPKNSRIDFLKSSVVSYVKPSKFLVTITPPARLRLDSISDLTTISMNCHKASVPGINLGTFEFRKGQDVLEKRPNDKIYSDLNLSFYNILSTSSKVLAWDIWKKWIDAINSNGAFEYYDNYIGRITVDQYSNNGALIKRFIFNEAYPTSLGQMDLDFADAENIQSFDVGITYKSWEIEEI